MADFSSAQQRILARRAARAAHETSQAAQRQVELSKRLLHLPPALRAVLYQAYNLYDDIRSPQLIRPSFRVGQVDAELLDEELLSLLTNNVGDGLKLFGTHLKDDYGAEIGLILRSIIWKLSIWDQGASYGASLQGLQYIDARHVNIAARPPPTAWQRIAYGLITVGGRYAWSRWEAHISELDNSYEEPSPLIRQLSRLTSLCGTTHDIAAFFSFLVFLYNGKYRTLTDRILRLRLVPSSNQTSREVSFEYLNRQLVWHAFTEFLLFLLPLVGITRWRRWISRFWRKGNLLLTKLRTGNAETEDEGEIRKGELGFLPERTCAICYQDQTPAGGNNEQDMISAGANTGIIGNASTDITNPYAAIPCECIYCYACLAQRIEAEEGDGWLCLRCGKLIKECQPWNGDVIAPRVQTSEVCERPGSSSRKSIAWADELVEEDEPVVSEAVMTHVDPKPVDDELYPDNRYELDQVLQDNQGMEN